MFAMRLLNAAAGQSYCENFHRTMGPSISDVAIFGTQCTANIYSLNDSQRKFIKSKENNCKSGAPPVQHARPDKLRPP